MKTDRIESAIGQLIDVYLELHRSGYGTVNVNYVLEDLENLAAIINSEEDETVTDYDDLETETHRYFTMTNEEALSLSFGDIARHFAKWGAEHTFTHHETDESLQEAVTHQMEDEQVIDDYVRKGLDEVCLRYAELGAKWGAEHFKK